MSALKQGGRRTRKLTPWIRAAKQYYTKVKKNMDYKQMLSSDEFRSFYNNNYKKKGGVGEPEIEEPEIEEPVKEPEPEELKSESLPEPEPEPEELKSESVPELKVPGSELPESVPEKRGGKKSRKSAKKSKKAPKKSRKSKKRFFGLL